MLHDGNLLGAGTGDVPAIEVVREVLAAAATQDWGYVDIRPDAHTFWWLFETTHPDGVENRPLVLWLQVSPALTIKIAYFKR